LVLLVSFPLIHFVDISHTKLRIGSHTHVNLANRTLVGLYSTFSPPLYVLPVMYHVQLTQLFLTFQRALPLPAEFLCHPIYSYIYNTTNCGFPFDTGVLIRSQYLFKVVSDLCFSFNSSGPISRLNRVVTFNGFTDRFSFSTIALVCTDATCSMDVPLSSVSEHSVSELFCSEVTSCVTLTSSVCRSHVSNHDHVQCSLYHVPLVCYQ